MTTEPRPSRGEVWDVDLGVTRGHEQARRRPGLVVSTDRFNHGPAALVIVLPMTTRAKGIPLHVAVAPPEVGVQETSYVEPEDIRSVSTDRLRERRGKVSAATLAAVERRLRVLLEL